MKIFDRRGVEAEALGDSCQAGQRCPVTQESTALLFNFPVYKCLEIVNVARKLNSVMQSVMTNYYMFSKVQTGRIIQRGVLHTQFSLSKKLT